MRGLLGVVLTSILAMTAGACSTGDGLGERDVRLTLPGQEVGLTMDGCARDGDVVVIGASSSTVLLQVLLRLDDEDDVVLDRSGITAEVGARGTLGAGDPDLIRSETGRAGTIESASVRGDRIEVVAEVVRTSRAGDVDGGRLELVARCAADDEVAAPSR